VVVETKVDITAEKIFSIIVKPAGDRGADGADGGDGCDAYPQASEENTKAGKSGAQFPPRQP